MESWTSGIPIYKNQEVTSDRGQQNARPRDCKTAGENTGLLKWARIKEQEQYGKKETQIWKVILVLYKEQIISMSIWIYSEIHDLSEKNLNICSKEGQH